MAGTARARQARARDAAEKGLLLSRVRVAARGCAEQGGATRVGLRNRVRARKPPQSHSEKLLKNFGAWYFKLTYEVFSLHYKRNLCT